MEHGLYGKRSMEDGPMAVTEAYVKEKKIIAGTCVFVKVGGKRT